MSRIRAESEGQRPKPFTIDRCISAIVTSLYNKLSSGASREYRARFDLGVIEWRIMFQLSVEPWLTGAQLSQAIGLDKSAVSRSLGLLEGRQLIQLRSVGARRRETALTRRGWKVYEVVLDIAVKRETCLLTGFTETETDTLIALLHRLIANLPLVEAEAQTRRDAAETGSAPRSRRNARAIRA
jgi:DNA-binding MarR family transcriptional regulator